MSLIILHQEVSSSPTSHKHSLMIEYFRAGLMRHWTWRGCRPPAELISDDSYWYWTWQSSFDTWVCAHRVLDWMRESWFFHPEKEDIQLWSVGWHGTPAASLFMKTDNWDRGEWVRRRPKTHSSQGNRAHCTCHWILHCMVHQSTVTDPSTKQEATCRSK